MGIRKHQTDRREDRVNPHTTPETVEVIRQISTVVNDKHVQHGPRGLDFGRGSCVQVGRKQDN